MTLPKPDAFNLSVARAFSRLSTLLSALPGLYEEAYDAALAPSVRESAGKVTTSEEPDPTGSVGFDHPNADRVSGQARIRRVLERIPKHLAEAENSIVAIERELASAMDRLDPHESFEPLRYPITVSHADLEESKEAQRKRRERGEVA